MNTINKLKTWAWIQSDKLDIWAQDKLGIKSPKQRALELKMDLNPNRRISNAIDEALGLRETTKYTPKKKTKRNKTTQ